MSILILSRVNIINNEYIKFIAGPTAVVTNPDRFKKYPSDLFNDIRLKYKSVIQVTKMALVLLLCLFTLLMVVLYIR